MGIILYEHKSLTVNVEKEAMYRDCYSSFGWEVEESETKENTDHVTIQMRRNRRILHREEINILQKKCEDALRQIQYYEMKGALWAIIICCLIGMAGVAFVVGAVFSFIANLIPGFIICAFLGLLGCTLPYFIYFKLSNQKAVNMEQVIEEQYDIVYDACEEAWKLLEASEEIERCSDEDRSI